MTVIGTRPERNDPASVARPALRLAAAATLLSCTAVTLFGSWIFTGTMTDGVLEGLVTAAFAGGILGIVSLGLLRYRDCAIQHESTILARKLSVTAIVAATLIIVPGLGLLSMN